jgi:hypothetical protein
MRASMREVHALDRRCQSRPVGARCAGSLASSVPISSRDKAHALSKDDERDPPQRRSREAPVAGARSLGLNQAALFVKAQRRSGDAAPARNLLNRQ